MEADREITAFKAQCEEGFRSAVSEVSEPERGLDTIVRQACNAMYACSEAAVRLWLFNFM